MYRERPLCRSVMLSGAQRVNPWNRKDLRGLLPIPKLPPITGNRIRVGKMQVNILTGMTAFTSQNLADGIISQGGVIVLLAKMG
jgi:hypothetical protein